MSWLEGMAERIFLRPYYPVSTPLLHLIPQSFSGAVMYVSYPMKWVAISAVSESIIFIYLQMKYLKFILLYLSDANLGDTEST